MLNMNDNSACANLLSAVTRQDDLPTNRGPIMTPAELEDLLKTIIGGEEVKKSIRSMYTDQMFYKNVLNDKGIIATPPHAMLMGPPGTGKSTIARKIAKVFYGVGVVKRDALEEVQASDLLGNHVGDAAVRTQALIDRAWGGCIFIDEAYQFTKSEFGPQAIDTCMKYMNRDAPVALPRRAEDAPIFIVAGYEWEMTNPKCGFLTINPGLARRFHKDYRITFQPYNAETILKIFYLKTKNLYKLPQDEPTKQRLLAWLNQRKSRLGQTNGAYANSMRDAITRFLAMRYKKAIKTTPGRINKQEMTTIRDPNDLMRALALCPEPVQDVIIKKCPNDTGYEDTSYDDVPDWDKDKNIPVAGDPGTDALFTPAQQDEIAEFSKRALESDSSMDEDDDSTVLEGWSDI